VRAAGVEPWVASLDPQATHRDHRVTAVDRVRGLLSALWRADAVISGGGGLLQDATSGRSLGYYLAVIRAAKLLRKPVAVFAQSLGPLSDAGAARVARTLRGVPIGLRDAPSLALAEALGLPAQPVADTALLLEPPTPARERDDATLVLVPRAGYPAISDQLATLGRAHLAAAGRVRIVLLHPRFDAAEGEWLARELPAAERPDVRDVAALQVALQGVRAVVSGRLHGLILGAGVGTPVAGLAYDPKVTGFARDIRAPVFPLAAERSDVAQALQAFVRDPRLDVAAVARLRARAADGVRWLCHEALHRSLHRSFDTGA